jgi:energy-coupling factor transporter ATP-binding protein EcfA2
MAGITIRGLSKSFDAREGEVAAVDGIDLDIADNSFVTLLGPSGCGKTTTLRWFLISVVPEMLETAGRQLGVAHHRIDQACLQSPGRGPRCRAARPSHVSSPCVGQVLVVLLIGLVRISLVDCFSDVAVDRKRRGVLWTFWNLSPSGIEEDPRPVAALA